MKWLKYGIFFFAFVILLVVPRWFIADPASTWSLPLSGKVIVIDPGHGGFDGGAVSRSGMIEKEITLKISKKLRDYFQEAGAYVILTRENDEDLAGQGTEGGVRRKARDLMNRVKIVNESNADFFISIHLNAMVDSRWSGAQTFYQKSFPENERLAEHIQEEVRKNLQNTTRVARPIHNIYLLKEAEIPGVLFEAGFLSNIEEAGRLVMDDYQNQIAAALYYGVMSYYVNEENEIANES